MLGSRKAGWLAAALLGLAPAASAVADTIAFDSYLTGSAPTAGEYQAGVVLKNQPTDLTNLGFVNGGYTSGTGTSQFSATTNGLVYAPLGASAASGKVNYSAAPLDNIYRANARNLTGVPTSDTYWINHLVNRGDIPAAGGTGYALTGFGNTVAPDAGATSGNMDGLFVGFAQDGVSGNFGNLVIRYRSGSNLNSDAILINGANTSTFGTTYDVVMKVDVNVGGGSTDQVTWWLNPTDFSSEAALTATSAASGTFASFAVQGASSFARLNYSARNWNGNAFFDEARLATNLAGLQGVPEPGSIAMLALGGLIAVGYRRRLARKAHA